MANAVVRDHVVWLKHIHDDAGLVQRLAALTAGAVVSLKVDGVPGKWCKMDDGRDGRPTPGLRPLGSVKAFWNALFNERRGELVSIELSGGDGAMGGGNPVTPLNSGAFAEKANQYAGRIERADPVMRSAAVAALLDAGRQTFIPDDNIVVTRDDMHDRELDRLR